MKKGAAMAAPFGISRGGAEFPAGDLSPSLFRMRLYGGA